MSYLRISIKQQQQQQQQRDHTSRKRQRPNAIHASMFRLVTIVLSIAFASTAECLAFNELQPCSLSSYAMYTAATEDRQYSDSNNANASSNATLPCIIYDIGPKSPSGNTAGDEVVVTVVQVTPPICSDHRDGAPTAVQLLNQDNGGNGTAIGYYNDHYVQFRLISVIVFSPDQHAEILEDMMATIQPQYIMGSCSPAANRERVIAERYQTILMAQVGPPNYYQNINNTYLFGFHLSSNGYTKPAMQALRFNAITDIPGGPPSQPVRILHRNDGDFFVSTCQAALNFAIGFGLTDVTTYSFDPLGDGYSDPAVNTTAQVKYLQELADSTCPPGLDTGYHPAIFVCSLTPEQDVLLNRWRENGCQPISMWLTASTQQWASRDVETVPYFQGGGQWHPAFTYRDAYFTSGTAFLDAQEETLGYRGSYDMVVSYSIITLFAKHLQWSYRVDNTPTVQDDFSTPLGYEKLRRDLLVLKAQTLFGPFSLQVGQQQNSGREVAGTQWLPVTENATENQCTSPLSQAETTIQLPAPSSFECDPGSAISLSKIQNEASILSFKCELCPVDTFSTGKGTNTSCAACPDGTNTNSKVGAITCVATDDNILSRPLVSMAFVFVCIVWSLAISMLSWILRHREADIVKTSRNYLLTMLTGALSSSTFIVSISLHAGTENSAQFATIGCEVAPFLYCIGWVLMLGSVAGLAHPVSKHPWIPHVYSYVEPRSPYPMFIALVLDIILLVLWTLLNPLEYSRWVVSETIDLETGLVTIDSVGFCSAGGDINTWFFVGPIAVVHACLVFRIVYLYFANKGKEDIYNQRQVCLFAALYSAQLLLIGVPVVLAVGNNTTARYAVMCGLIFCNDLGVVSIIFFPIRNRRKTCEEYQEEAPLTKRAKLKKKAKKAAELRKAKVRKAMMNSFSQSNSSDSFGALDLEALGLPEPSMNGSKIQKIDEFDCTEQSKPFS